MLLVDVQISASKSAWQRQRMITRLVLDNLGIFLGNLASDLQTQLSHLSGELPIFFQQTS